MEIKTGVSLQTKQTLSQVQMESLNVLSMSMTELREFYFYAYGENVSVDLSPLAGLTKLNILSITAQSYYDSPNPSVTNLSALENLQDLRTLELVCTNVSNFSPLRSLENLQSVTIINNGEDVFLD